MIALLAQRPVCLSFAISLGVLLIEVARLAYEPARGSTTPEAMPLVRTLVTCVLTRMAATFLDAARGPGGGRLLADPVMY